MLVIGQILYGYCGGHFDGSYNDKVIEVIRPDYIVVRDTVTNKPIFEYFKDYNEMVHILKRYTIKIGRES